jgi:post-segregation antitoxin (ccd killing protein)
MRQPLFEAKAAKQTVSVTLNSDLYAKAKSAGINMSKVAEQALVLAYTERCRDVLKAELRRDLDAAESYAEIHGAFADLVREQYERDHGAV